MPKNDEKDAKDSKAKVSNMTKTATHLESIATLTVPTKQQMIQPNVDTVLWTLNVPSNENILFNNEKLKRIKLIAQEIDRRVLDPYRKLNIEITTQKGEKKLFSVDMKDRYELIKFFETHGVYPSNAFSELGGRRLAFWDTKNVDEFYKRGGHNISYNLIHETLADLVADFDHEKKPVKLFVYGTGPGNDARAVLKKLKSCDIPAAAVGFDFNEGNIKDAKKFQKQSPDLLCDFVQGDSVDLLKLYNQQKNNEVFSAMSPNPKTVILFSGSATRFVLEGTKEALYIFQQAYHCADIVFSGGLEPTLLTPKMAKRCGWNLTVKPPVLSSGSEPFFILEKIPALERVQWLKKRFDKDPTTIDLSMSADPIRDLELLQEQKLDFSKVKTIDLSYTFVPDDAIPKLKDALKPFTDKQIVIKDNPLQTQIIKSRSPYLTAIAEPQPESNTASTAATAAPLSTDELILAPSTSLPIDELSPTLTPPIFTEEALPPSLTPPALTGDAVPSLSPPRPPSPSAMVGSSSPEIFELSKAASSGALLFKSSSRETRTIYEPIASKLIGMKNVTFESGPPVSERETDLEVFSERFRKRHGL